MTAPPVARRVDVRCPRCARTQPPLPPGVYQCVYCGTGLPLQRWVATRPPAALTPAVPRRRAAASPARYGGPPSYGQHPPRWGFAPAVWHRIGDDAPSVVVRPPLGELRVAAWFAAATAVLGLAAAGAETWRFTLMLRGRTEVLAGGPVAVSDGLVVATGWLALVSAMITAIVAVPALVQAYRAAAEHAGMQPARTPLQVWMRVVIPGWNIWGAGQMLAETESMLVGGPVRVSRPVRWWWAFWVLSAGLVLAAIIRTFFGGLQAIADTVELHIAVDVTAGVVGLLSCWVLLRLVRLFRGPRPSTSRWAVAAPQPTREVLADPDAVAARRASGVLPVGSAEVAAARLARPVTREAGADEVLGQPDTDDADPEPTR